MRVISGIRKGHGLKAPKGIEVRPTEDKIKESIFNILVSIDKKDSVILDLFAGSGSIGIEFLSRGAKTCYFVDISSKSIQSIKENLLHTNLNDLATVIKSDSLKAIKDLGSRSLKFDFIYLDPPFRNSKLLYQVLNAINDYQLLSANGLIIIEHESELIFEDQIFDFKKTDERRYSSKRVSFFKGISRR